METSERIDKIAPALVSAQTSVGKAHKKSDNPFHKSKYADLASVFDACQEALNSNGLMVLQPIKRLDSGAMVLETIILHESTQWVKSEILLAPVKNDPQAMGSAITYARRQTLSALVGICPEDDDGNDASGNTGNKNKNSSNRTKPKTQNNPMSPPGSKTPPSKLKPITPDNLVLEVADVCQKMEESTTIQHLDNIQKEHVPAIKQYQGHEQHLKDLRETYTSAKRRIVASLQVKNDDVPGLNEEETNNALPGGAEGKFNTKGSDNA